jgi:DNA anti-recombination protein RmuC
MENEILEIIKDYKNRPNKDLIKVLDLLSKEFELTKDTLIKLSKHLDKVEQTYNTILKEYDGRTKS